MANKTTIDLQPRIADKPGIRIAIWIFTVVVFGLVLFLPKLREVLTIKNPPNVVITTPTHGTSFIAPASFNIDADARDNNRTIVKVEFYSNETLLGEDLTAPYSVPNNNLAVGTYTLTSVATDNEGGVSTSTAVIVNVNPYEVVITSPTDGASFIGPVAFDIDAYASDNNGTIVKVEFYSNGRLLGEDLTAPYSIAQSNLPVGTYTLTAVATDNEGVSATSTIITVNELSSGVIIAPTHGTSYTAPAFSKLLPALNASINSICFLVLITSLIMIKKKNVIANMRLNTFAMILSVIFLLSYVLYHITNADTPYGGEYKVIYYSILITHILTSAISLPFILFAYYWAFVGDVVKHRKIVKWAYPVWLYVAITGPSIYVFLSPYYGV